MDNVLSRFPHLGEQIFKKLNDESLSNCHQLTRACRLFIEDQKFFWIRVIKKLLDDPRFKKSDRDILINKVLLKFKFDSVKNIGTTIREFCKINLSISRGQALLHFAAMSGEIDIVKNLSNENWDNQIPNQKDNRGRTPLHFAAKNGHYEVFKFIWKDQKKKMCKEKNPEDHMELTPFHFAAQMGHVEICEFIFRRLNHVGSTKRLGLTPLHFAAEGGHLEVCKLFINAKKRGIDRLDDKNPRSEEEGNTPLHLAAKAGHLNVCQFIIEKVQDKNPKNDRNDTPLHLAAENGHLQVCELIIGQFVEKIPIHINPPNLFRKTPLQNAFLHGHDRVYQLINQVLGYPTRPEDISWMKNVRRLKKSNLQLQQKND